MQGQLETCLESEKSRTEPYTLTLTQANPEIFKPELNQKRKKINPFFKITMKQKVVYNYISCVKFNFNVGKHI